MLVGVAQAGRGPLDQHLVPPGRVEVDLIDLPVLLPTPQYGCMRLHGPPSLGSSPAGGVSLRLTVPQLSVTVRHESKGRRGVTIQSTSDVYYDPYDVDIDADPYPVFRRLREEAPLYYNEAHDFYAAEPVRGRRARPARQQDVHLRAWRHHRAHQGQHRDALGRAHLRGPARAHHPPATDVAGLHAQPGGGARAPDPRVLRPQPRPAGRRRRVRLHRRPRGADAHAGHRHAARHPRAGPGGRPRPGRRQPAHRGGQAHGGLRGLRSRPTCSASTSTGGPTTPRTTS